MEAIDLLRPADDVMRHSNGNQVYLWDDRFDPCEVSVALVTSMAGRLLKLSYGTPDRQVVDEHEIRATLASLRWRQDHGVDALPIEGSALAAASGVNPLFGAITKTWARE